MFLGLHCLDRLDGKLGYFNSLEPMYKDEETDPLKYAKKDERIVAYRPFFRTDTIKSFAYWNTAITTRVVIGPDLMKEKGFDKK